MKIALIQLNAGDDISANLARLESLVAQAAAEGACFIATPEHALLMQQLTTVAGRVGEAMDKAVAAAQMLARRHGVWLLIGSVTARPDHGGDSEKSYNRSLLMDPDGVIAAYYNKIHLFDADVPGDRRYCESDTILPGDKAVVAPLRGCDPWVMGMSVCYDLRFGHLYRALAKAGANLLAVPAAFTALTGAAHWHVLLRARAIETGCYVIAPAQTGRHPGGRETYGHSLVVDPWGKVVVDAGAGEGIIYAQLDASAVQDAQARMPCLSHDRRFAAPKAAYENWA